jgi:Fe-S oxidoreductase
LREEAKGPRGKAILINEDALDKSFYDCTLCGACRVFCPVGIDVDRWIRKVRERLIKEGLETKANEVMIKNIREFGNPFGELKGAPSAMYCC